MTEKSVNRLSEEEIKSFVKSFDTAITFCEGILCRRNREIYGSANAIETLKKYGKRILYFSRDCSSSRREIAEKMRKANYEIKPNEIVSITSLMAKYLKKRLDEKKVYVIGSTGVSEELDAVGLQNFGTGPDILTTDLATFAHSYEDDPEIGAVVVGLDEYFSYPKMLRAASYLSVADVIHIACTERTRVTAALVACIETCSDKRALILENSASLVKETIMDGYRILPERTLIIGPGNNDDIRLARFHRFGDFLSTTCTDTSSLLDSTNKFDESSSRDSIFRANDLAEFTSILKI